MYEISYITRMDASTGRMTSPDGKRKIFISYKHSDEMEMPLCARLASYILEKHDVAVWYDRQLSAGQEYDREILSAIRGSDVFVLLLTPSILSSQYVWEQEIPFAQKNQVAIIPVIAGLPESEISRVEQVIGRVHMPLWFRGKQETVPSFPTEALQQFHNGLSISIANKDIMSQVMLFYERGNHKTSLRYLTFEQIFMKAYGCLFAVDREQDKHMGEMLMETILHTYSDDAEFISLQKQVAQELLKHFFRSNQPELFVAYLKPMLDRGFSHVLPLLFDAYRQQWHPEILENEPELSIALFTHLYSQYTGKTWDCDALLRQLRSSEPILPKNIVSSFRYPAVGQIRFGDHRAYFRRSETEDRTVYLMLDDDCLSLNDVYASVGDVSFLFLAYDENKRLLIKFYADFDHYGPETYLSGRVYQLHADGVRSVSFSENAVRGIRPLPYSPYTFGTVG